MTRTKPDFFCDHSKTSFVKVLFKNNIYHIKEICKNCKINVRGTDWVSVEEVKSLGIDIVKEE